MRTLILTLLFCGVAHAGPWTRASGQAYVKLGANAFAADEFVDASGTTVDAEYLGFTSSLYAEVGVAERLHLQLYLPHVVGRNTNDTGDRFLSAGLGDLSVGAQFSPGFSFPSAVRLEAKLPLYDVTEPGGYQGDLFPNRGDGQIDVTLWLSVGQGWGALYGFVEAGHRFRTEAFPGTDSGVEYGDSAVATAQLGYDFGVILAANANAVLPYAEDEATKGYLNVGPSLFAPIGAGIALEAAYDFTAFATNSSVGQSVTLGISYLEQ